MLITTSLGDIDEKKLKRVEQIIDNDNEHTTIIEYYLDGVAVHRSAHVVLKNAGVTAAMLCNGFR